MKSTLFYSDKFVEIEKLTKNFLNQHKDFLTTSTAGSPRAVGDAIEGIICDNFEQILGDECSEYSAKFARRAMADLAFKDKNGFYYVIDIKTHREDTKFNMPNLTSVERLTRFYEDDSNYFALLLIKYKVQGIHVVVSKVTFVPIEFLDWDCLTVGALGWGQIQIANANRINIKPQYFRKKWMLELCDIMLDFYPHEIGKIRERVKYFKTVKKRWQQKKE